MIKLDLFTFVNIIILLALLGVLFYMQKKHISFSKRVLTGLGLGIILGVVLQLIYEPDSETLVMTNDWFGLVGSGYVKLLQMIVMPLVFISIVAAFTRLEKSSNIGKISGLVIGTLMVTTAIAAAIGIASAAGFDLKAIDVATGDAELTRGEELESSLTEVQSTTVPQKILEFLPANPFLDLTGARATSTIAVVIFAAFVGVAYLGVKRKNPEQAAFFQKMIDSLHSLVMRIVTLVLRLTPYGILALMAKTVAGSDFQAIATLGKFVIASYVALLAMFLVHLLILTIMGLSPKQYVKKVTPVLAFAFTSRTSAGTLPLNVEAQRNKLGVPESIANFSASFGITIGQNGCAGIYPAMLAVMIAPTQGINPLSPSFIATLIVVVMISSFGVAGVGGGATFASLIVLSTMNLPVALAGVLISIEPLIDMGRTALNVSGSMVSGLVTSRTLGELDTKTYRSTEAAADSAAG
ncbi:L-cystine transporter [Terribacillus sp. 7520-G]|uniref:L-cystine transporter n=1 Tax=Terribacillus TaxID=459532 RepID=UPI000BA6A6B0|nr:L-cystine transporter [Terribacillus sp. 7520-G]PAD39298.1 L-cystine transporter [Terribacillus sp. 7520-G]